MGNNPKSALDAWKKRNAITAAPQSGATNGAGASAPASGASAHQPKTALEAWKERNQPVATSRPTASVPTAAPVEKLSTEQRIRQLQQRKNELTAGLDLDGAAEVQAQIDRLQWENGTSFWQRVGNVLSGAGKQTAASYSDAASTMYEAGQKARDNQNDFFLKEYQMQYDDAERAYGMMMEDNAAKPGTWTQGDLDGQLNIMADAKRKLDAMGYVVDNKVQERATTTARDLNQKLSESGAKDTEKAKEGLGGVGRLAVDAATGLAQLGGDIVAGAATGGGATVPLLLRSFGGGTMRARQDGASLQGQLAYGGLTALTELLTEKIGSVGRIQTKAFGKGGLDDIFEGVVAAAERAGKTPAGRATLNRLASAGTGFVSEGLEEAVSAAVEPLIAKATYGRELPDIKQLAQDVAYDFLVGGAIGGVTGGVGGTDTSKVHWRTNEQGTENAATKESGEDVRYLPAPMGEDAALATQRPAEDDVRPLPKAEDIENAASGTETAGKPRVSMEDFVNSESPVWNNVAYEDSETKTRLMQEAHQQMMSEGRVVQVEKAVTDKVAESFPDVRSLPRAEKNNVLKQAITALKIDLRGVLKGLTGQDIEFDVNGNVLEARLYSTGINEVLKSIGQTKAGMLYNTKEIFKNAQYLYSTPDKSGDPNIYRWNYFYTPVRIGKDTVGVRIAVRDMATPAESQIYNWGIKKDATLGGAGRGQDRIPSGASSDASMDSISEKHPNVNRVEVEDDTDTDLADAIPDEDVALPLVPTTDPKVQREWNRAAKIAHNFGCRLVVGVPEGGGEGSYLNGVITINPNCKNPVMQVLLHELTHRLENSRLYGKLTLFARNWLDSHGVDVDARIQEIIEEREVQGYSLSERGAMQEVVAQFVQEHLFRNEQAIRRLLREDRTLWQKIRNWLQDAVRWVRKAGGLFDDLYRAERLFEKALRGSDPKMGMSEAQHMIETLPDGRKYVKADRQVILGNDPEAWGDQIELYINRKIRGGEDVMLIANDGTELWLTADTEGKASFRNYVKDEETGKERLMTDEEYLAKLNAEAHIDELAQISEPTNGTPVEDEGGRHGELAENGWYYRTAFFRDFDGTYYRVTLSVPSGRNGFTVYNVGRMRERSLPTSSGSSAYAALNGEETSLEHSVRQDGAVVNKENSAERPEYYASMDDVPADDVRPLPRAEDLERDAARSDAQMEPISEEPDATAEDPAEQLPTKAREYLKRVERRLVARISGALSVPFGAQREFLRPVVEFITREFLQTGRVSQETLDGLFDSAYDAGIVVDTEYYDNYKFVRDHLRKTALTLSKTDQADIADFGDFRKSILGLLKLKNEGGLPVDVAYMEMRSMAPDLFPEDITYPAEQLVRIAEVVKGIEKVEKTLDDYYGPDAEEFKAWAKRDFEGAVNDMLGELRTVARYAQEQTAKKAEKLTHSPEDVRKAFDEIRAARKAKEKAVARNLLTDQDNALVSRLLKGEITLEDIDPAKANVRGIREVFEASQEYERLRRVIGEYNRLRKAKLYEQVDKFLETANSWKDKSAGFWYSRETMERNIRDIVPDRSVAQSVIDFFFAPIHKAEAASTRFKNSYRERVKALGLSRKVAEGNEVSEAHAVQFVGEAQDNIRVLQESKGRMKSRDGKTLKDWQAEIENLWANNPGLDRAKIEDAVKEFRSIYDELFQQMNEVRVRNGYEPVAYRQGYFPHFQSTGEGGMLAAFGKALGFDTSVAALPTTINGLTHTFRPGITWMANAQERQGFATVYDAVEGFDKYINGAADVIHHTDNIQRLRALADRIRYRTGDKGIREQLDALKDRKDLSEQEKDAIRKDIHEKGKYTLSRFVVELEEYTNLLANKKSIHDRNAEHDFGRKIYQVVKNVMGRVAGNMVALNPGSWLTNFIPITQAWGTVSSGEILQAMWDTLRSYKADDGLVERSAFLTNRRGSNPLVRSWSEQASATLSKPMEWIDAFTSDVVVRAKYLQNLKRGMSEDMALTDADAFAAGVIADRSKGATPTLFRRSNPVTKLLTQFQLEVNNQFSYLAKDIPDELKEKALGTLAAALFKFFLGAFLYNEVYEFFVGRRPALDPIGILNDTVGDLSGWELPNLVELGTGAVTGDMPSFRTERTGVYGAGLAMGTNVAEELPFIGGLLGGGRVPISSALPDPTKLWGAATNTEWSGKKRVETGLKEVAKPLLYTLPPFGGGQLKKTVEGVGAAVQGGSYSVDSKTGKGALQYPVYNDTPGEMAGALVKGTVFGKSALKTAQEWVEDGFDSYNVRYTDVYRQMNDVGVSDREAHKLLDDIRSAKKSETESADTAKKRVLLESDINEDGKLVTYLGLLAGNDQEEVEKKRDKMAVTVAAGATIDDWLEFEVKVSGKTKRAEKLQVIDGMDLTWKQKDAFYAAAGLSEKTLDEAPWYIERYRLPAP